MKIQNKQDVIKWLKRLKEDHPLASATVRTVKEINGEIKSFDVWTDGIIRDRYQGLIDYLESDEVA